MAGGNPAWSPLHPSPGFLLKCGKEHEKLKLRIRSQLQSHMLSLFEDGLFSDVTIESLPGDSSDGPVLKAHKAVLLVRVPFFWKRLVEKCAVSGKGTNEFAVPLDKDLLRDFLRSVYSDDDIRKKEHDILRALCAQDGPPSTDDEGGDEDFQDVTGEANTEEATQGGAQNSSPSGPGGDIDEAPSSSFGQMGAEDSLENFRACFVSHSDGLCIESHAPATSNVEEPLDSLCDNSQVYDESQVCDDVSESRDECSLSMNSSMVRSGTFDLQSQMPLDMAIENWNGDEAAALIGARECVEQQRNAEPKAAGDRKADAKVCTEQDGKSLATMPAFFLHEKSSAPMPVSYQRFPQTPKVTSHLGGGREGSAGAFGMNDSGFLSQNTSVTEAVAYDSLNNTGETPLRSAIEQSESRPNPGHHSSSALFPFYIDMNRARAEEKQSQQQREPSNQGSSLYMYIDANGEASAGQVQKRSPSSKSKADSDSSKRPQSCYMYVDFNTVRHEESQPDEKSSSRTMPRTLSLSMFIDINDDQSDSVVCAQEAYSNNQGNPAKKGENAVERQRSIVEHCMWEHFEREEILVVSEEIPTTLQPTRPAVGDDVSSPRRAMTDHIKVQPSEVCLLPMSPIPRRKTKPESVKPAPRTLPVKSSTRPQDVYAMTFRRPEPCGGEDSDSLEHESDREADVPEKKSLPESEELTAAVAVVEGSDSVSGPSTSLVKKPEAGIPLIKAQTSEIQEPPAATTKESVIRPPFSPVDGDDDSETVYSEVSEVSCLSSIDKRMQGSGCSPERLGACSKLGDDLLRMFIGQMETDVTIRVEGKDIGAHRFILASRSDYFSLIFRKEFAAEESETISMDGFTHDAVVFALHHLYGGAATPPREVHVSELALLAEVLGVDSLRRVVVSHVRTYYCHFFHKPCSQCIAGVVECLQMAPCCSGLRELQTRAVQWAGRHYIRVWPHRAFASVPEHWQQQCYAATLQALTAETAVDMALNCERLSVTLPRVRWAESALSLANRLLHDCVGLMSREFDQVLQSKSFLDLGKGQSWNITALEDTLLAAVEGLTPDAACLSCIALARLLPEDDSQQMQWTQNFTDLLRKIHRQCERFLIHNANRVVHCQSWSSLSPQLQKKIRDAAIIVFEFEKPLAPPPRLSSLRRPRRKSAGGAGTTDTGGEASKDSASPSPARRPRSLAQGVSSSSPKTSGSDSSELHGPTPLSTAGPSRPTAITRRSNAGSTGGQGLSNQADSKRPAGSPVDSKAALTGALSESLDSYRESSSDSGKEQIRSAPRSEKKMAIGARNSRARITRGARSFPNVPRDLGARPKSVATWAAPVAHSSPINGGITGERGNDVSSSSPIPLTVWANPQSRPPTQYFQSLRQVQSKVDSGRPLHRCSGQVVRVPPFTIKSDMPPATAAVDDGTAVAEVVRPPDSHHSLQRGSSLGIASNNNNLMGNGGANREEEDDACDNSSGATGEPSPDASPDFVAEIDAESNLVSHCLQEAELLERELSRKLRKQKRGPDPDVVPYTRPPALRGGATASASGAASGNLPHRRRTASTSEARAKSSSGLLTAHSRAASLHGPLPPSSAKSPSSALASRSTHMTSRSPGTGGPTMVVRIPGVSAPAMHLQGRAVSGSDPRPPQRVSGIAVSTKPSIRR
ncbi:uncharacterized protein LOC119160953 [Rhipicephalus microplus]|uniref:uncharacterized protein LOC119160953 n=1 Tax=Rhipicephalus microplus TaxID=6941 RepID=UPI003F6D9DE5